MRIYRVDGVCAHKGQAGFGYRQLTAAAAFLVCGWTWLAGAGRVGLEAGGPAGTRRSGRFLLAYISETHLPLGLFLGLSGYTSLDMPPVLHPGFDSASAVDTRCTPREEGEGVGSYFQLDRAHVGCWEGSFRYQVLLFHTLEQGFLDARGKDGKGGDWDGMGMGGRLVGEATRRSSTNGAAGGGAVGCFALVGFYIEN